MADQPYGVQTLTQIPLDIVLSDDHRTLSVNVTRTASGQGDVRVDLGFAGPVNDKDGINQHAEGVEAKNAAVIYVSCYMTSQTAKALATALRQHAARADEQLNALK